MIEIVRKPDPQEHAELIQIKKSYRIMKKGSNNNMIQKTYEAFYLDTSVKKLRELVININEHQ